MNRACDNTKDGVLALDGVIDTKNIVHAAIQGRIGLIIESGDSPNSKEILKIADKYGISMIFTGIRNNKY